MSELFTFIIFLSGLDWGGICVNFLFEHFVNS